MITAIISLVKLAEVPFKTFTHILLPVMVVETILDMVLINKATDWLDRKKAV